MGMFDYVRCDAALPDDEARAVREWQTKEFDAPSMDTFHITAEGRLMEEVYHTEDRGDKSAPDGSLERVRGIWTKIHEGWRDMNYHGTLEFHGIAGWEAGDGQWDDARHKSVRCVATFVNGQLVSVGRAAPDGGTP